MLVVAGGRLHAGWSGQLGVQGCRNARVAAMTGIDRDRQVFDKSSSEFPPWLDLVAPVVGAIGLLVAGVDAGTPVVTQVLRVLVGAAFLGAVTDPILLGPWYLPHPGLPRAPPLAPVPCSR